MKIPSQPLDIFVSWSKYLLTFWEHLIVQSFFQGVKISGTLLKLPRFLKWPPNKQWKKICSALPNMVIYVYRRISVMCGWQILRASLPYVGIVTICWIIIPINSSLFFYILIFVRWIFLSFPISWKWFLLTFCRGKNMGKFRRFHRYHVISYF